MQIRHLTYTYHTAGTLAADHSFIFTLPFDCTLVQVSAVGTNVNNGILDVGSVATPEAYVKDLDVGDSSVPATRSLPAHFVGSNFPHIVKNTVIKATLDFDGAAGTAVQNFTLVLIFSVG